MAADGILATELRHVLADLQRLVGEPVHEAWVPSPTTLVLRVGGELLLLSTWPFARLHTVRHRPRNPAKPYSFQGLLRARLHGRLTALRQVGDDRVVELEVGDHVIHARLFGRGGGIWLQDRERVLAASDGPAADTLPPAPVPRGIARPPRFAPEPEEDWDIAARRFLGRAAAAARSQDLRVRLGRHLRKALAKSTRLAEALQGDLAAIDGADALRHRADCLAAVLHTVRPGTREVEVPDLWDPTVHHRVALDPARPPSTSLTALYDKARRLDRARETTARRLAEAVATREDLQAQLDALDDADLRTLEQAATAAGVAHAAPPPRAAAGAQGWATWTGPDGDELLVGRSAAGNHALVFRRGRGRDWWLHLRDGPGAHVLLPTTAQQPPPLERLLVAAELALRAAGVPEGAAADVQYTRVRDLRPVPGEPGRVQVRGERVLHVVRDPTRLAGWSQASGR